MLAFVSTGVLAQNWQSEGVVHFTVLSTDNPRLEFEGAEDTIETSEVVRIDATKKSRNTFLRVGAEAEFVQFSQSNLLEDEDNQRLYLTLSHDSSQRVNLGLNARYSRDTHSLRQAVEKTIDPIDTPDPNIEPPLGNVEIASNISQARVNRLYLYPSVRLEMGRRSTLRFNVGYAESSYDEDNIFAFSDNSSTGYSLEYRYELSERTFHSLALKAGYTDYATEAARLEVDGTLFQRDALDAKGTPVILTYRRMLGRNSFLEASAGATRITFDKGAFENETESLFRVRIATLDTKERNTFDLSFNESIQPSSIGTFTKAEDFSFTYDYKLTRNSNSGIRLKWTKNTQLGIPNARETEYKLIQPYYSFRTSIGLDFTLAYRWREVEREVSSVLITEDTADENSVLLEASYKLW